MGKQQHAPRGRATVLRPSYLGFFVLAALLALAGTFLLVNSAASYEMRTRGFSAIVGVFLLICIGLYLGNSRQPREVPAAEPTDAAADALSKLDHAGAFFAGSLKPADILRLIASCVREIVPARTVTLFLLDKTRQRLQVAETDGADAVFTGGTFLANTCFVKRAVHIDEKGGVAIPLINNTEPFGVLELDCDPADLPDEAVRSVYDAIGTRVAPLVLNSIAFDRSVSNALTDATTNLPNERALYLILENQIAEAQRKRVDRPLTILALDVNDFDGINQRFGHAVGDRVLNHVAQMVRDSLRQMDFLARCSGDEFLAVLPTASKEVADDVAARINASFFGRRLPISDEDAIEVSLNFASAAFGEDGETADQMIAAARLRKDGAKSSDPARVLWFSQNERTKDVADTRV